MYYLAEWLELASGKVEHEGRQKKQRVLNDAVNVKEIVDL